MKDIKWLEKELKEIYVLMPPDRKVQWWIDKDKLPDKSLNKQVRNSTGQFVKGSVNMKDLTWDKKNPHKKCRCCGEKLHITKYRPRISRSKRIGWLALHSECMGCENSHIYGKQRDSGYEQIYQGRGSDRARKAKDVIMEYFGNKCNRCKGRFQRVQMDMDHTDPEKKKMHLSQNDLKLSDGKHTVEDIIKELENIQLVCSNCHRMISTNFKHHIKEPEWYCDDKNNILYKMTLAEEQTHHPLITPKALNTTSA